MSTLGLFNEVLLLLFPLLILILITSLSKKKGAHCLKITQNVAFELLNFGIFHKSVLSGNTV